jgi:transcriptional regulator with XRE-family HTH domain
MQIAAQLGGRIRQIRISKGMSQQVLSNVTGLDRTHLSRIENGQYRFQLDTLEVIAQGLRVNLSDLFETIRIDDIWETRPLPNPPYKGLEKPA